MKGAGADPGQDPNDPIGLRAGALALIASILWGGNSVFIKVGLADMPPVALALARFMLGAATVWCGATVMRKYGNTATITAFWMFFYMGPAR